MTWGVISSAKLATPSAPPAAMSSMCRTHSPSMLSPSNWDSRPTGCSDPVANVVLSKLPASGIGARLPAAAGLHQAGSRKRILREAIIAGMHDA